MNVKTLSWGDTPQRHNVYYDIDLKLHRQFENLIKPLSGPLIKTGDLFIFNNPKSWKADFVGTLDDSGHAIMSSRPRTRIPMGSLVMFLFRVGEFRVVFFSGRHMHVF